LARAQLCNSMNYFPRHSGSDIACDTSAHGFTDLIRERFLDCSVSHDARDKGTHVLRDFDPPSCFLE
jgi:hypothetical protein